ncbi:uncharacterized protein LOC143153887 [Ptiloglossa arizonensis]|uniref:uncharacterized protein LOC143153887 n=1 Tax=Ptiloglossa arizonensis TaxID=3350558 RepID=UPI003F9F9C51
MFNNTFENCKHTTKVCLVTIRSNYKGSSFHTRTLVWLTPGATETKLGFCRRTCAWLTPRAFGRQLGFHLRNNTWIIPKATRKELDCMNKSLLGQPPGSTKRKLSFSERIRVWLTPGVTREKKIFENEPVSYLAVTGSTGKREYSTEIRSSILQSYRLEESPVCQVSSKLGNSELDDEELQSYQKFKLETFTLDSSD